MYTLIIISLIFLGLVFGSFGSVIFYRLGDWPTKETWKGFLIGRSECPKCHHQLHAKNLIPLFSWLFQGGKCEYCKTKISWFYPFLELSTVIIFVGLFLLLGKYGILNHPIGLKEGYIYMPFILISAWLLWLILLYDIKTYELHITATVFLYIISLFFTLFFGVNKLQILLGILIFTIIFIGIYFLGIFIGTLKFKKKSEGFGLGDVTIAPILGARLTFFIKPSGVFEWCHLITLYIILMSIIGIIYFICDIIIRKIMIIKKRKKLKKNYSIGNTGLPFLPSMIIGFILEIFLWNPFIHIIYLWNSSIFFN